MKKFVNTGKTSYKTFTGTFKPLNPSKYIGKTLPIFRSSWEAKAFISLDKNQKVIKWGSECFVIPYIDSTRGNTTHRYIIDLYFEIININNEIEKWLIEIKPYNQSTITKQMTSKLSSEKLLARQLIVERNQCKWKFATQFAKSKNMHFGVWTEKGIEKIC